MGFRGRRMFRPRFFRPFFYRPMFWWPRLLLWGGFMYFLFGPRHYKLHRDDVTIIERDNGKHAQELSEEELVQTMKKLGIKKIEISNDEKETIERH